MLFGVCCLLGVVCNCLLVVVGFWFVVRCWCSLIGFGVLLRVVVCLLLGGCCPLLCVIVCCVLLVLGVACGLLIVG